MGIHELVYTDLRQVDTEFQPPVETGEEAGASEN
jgi:hypothetical protein